MVNERSWVISWVDRRRAKGNGAEEDKGGGRGETCGKSHEQNDVIGGKNKEKG